MSAQIKLYYQFGEWQLYAKLHRLLSQHVAPRPVSEGFTSEGYPREQLTPAAHLQAAG